MRTFIFACVHNAGRSQIAAALFNRIADPAKTRAISAGTQPADRVHPEVIQAMREIGIDLAATTPRKLTAALGAGAEMLITMGCGEQCPYLPAVRREDWPLADPKGQSMEAVRALRQEIEHRVLDLVAREGLALPTAP